MGRTEAKSLSQGVYTRLKWEILDMMIQPGALLTEQSLAVQYQTSKTPVREALNRLVSEELVTVMPHKGYVVSDISYGELLEIFQFREILEAAAVELAMQNATVQQMNELELLANKMPETFSESEIPRANSLLNNQFHMYLVSISNNALFMQTYEQIMERLYRVLLKDTQKNRASAIRTEHTELVSLMRSGDRAAACDYIRGHVRRTKERVLKI